MGKDREDRFARRALDTPESDPAQADTDIMGVAGQAPAAATGRLVCKLKAKGQEKGEDAFDKRLAIAKQLKVGGFILEINGDGAVFSRRFGRCAHVSPLGHQVLAMYDSTRG